MKVTVGKSYPVKRMLFDSLNSSEEQYGLCVWIHPRARFAILRFPDGLKESFPLDENGELFKESE